MDGFSLADASQFEVLAVVLATLLAGALSGMTGFGGGLLLPPVLAPIIGVKAVVPVMSVAMLMANGRLYRDQLDRRLTLVAIAAALPGVLVGSNIYVRLPGQAIAVILGVFLLVAVPLGRYLANRSLRLSPPQLAAGCALYGLGSGTTTGVGMFLVPMLLGSGLAGAAVLSTDAAIGLMMNVTNAAIFGSYTLLELQLVLMGICTLPGNYLGRWILHRTRARVHTRLMEGLIVFGGLSLLWRPARDLLQML